MIKSDNINETKATKQWNVTNHYLDNTIYLKQDSRTLIILTHEMKNKVKASMWGNCSTAARLFFITYYNSIMVTLIVIGTGP